MKIVPRASLWMEQSQLSPLALSRALLWALGLRLERRIPSHQKTGGATEGKAPTIRPVDLWGGQTLGGQSVNYSELISHLRKKRQK